MAYQGSKGWYVQQLKRVGITKHPVEHKKLELYKTFVVRNLYLKNVVNK
ncbi:MAG: YflJ family protein [Bacillus sp. (in: Bacteria)]|nr:YflJ family protein [Bacillus sp. (in: firmicutes)]